MPRVERSVLINAPASKVEAVLIDPKNAKSVWNTDVFTVSGDWPSVGSEGKGTTKLGPMTLNTTMKVIDHVPAVKHVQTMSGSLTGKIGWTFQPEGHGTRLTVTIDYEAPGGAFGAALDKIILERQVNGLSDQIMTGAKKQSEG